MNEYHDIKIIPKKRAINVMANISYFIDKSFLYCPYIIILSLNGIGHRIPCLGIIDSMKLIAS